MAGPASMRPGLKAPENPGARRRSGRRVCRFNEAGAKSPGERNARRRHHCPGQASMRPGLKAPENSGCQRDEYRSHRASMRPGLKAPENRPFQAPVRAQLTRGRRERSTQRTRIRPPERPCFDRLAHVLPDFQRATPRERFRAPNASPQRSRGRGKVFQES